jgi:cytochrome c oxidase subunit II
LADQRPQTTPDAPSRRTPARRHRAAALAAWPRLRPLLLAAPLAAAMLLASAPGALAFITPEAGGSPNASSIDDLYKIVLYVAVVVFVVVEGALGYACWRFSARRHKVAEQTHGHTGLEIGWTLAAGAIVVVLAAVTLLKLSSIRNPPSSDANGASLASAGGALYADAEQKPPPNGKALRIEVIGRQYIWQYVYPVASNRDGLGAPYSYEQMVVPTHTTVVLDAVSMDVVHSWWIPELGGKIQVVPGYHNYTWFKIDRPGLYRGQCANICGQGHARMIASVRALPPAQFEAWLANQKREIAEANVEAAKTRLQLESEGAAKP